MQRCVHALGLRPPLSQGQAPPGSHAAWAAARGGARAVAEVRAASLHTTDANAAPQLGQFGRCIQSQRNNLWTGSIVPAEIRYMRGDPPSTRPRVAKVF